MRGFPIVGAWRRIFMSAHLSQHSKLLCTETSKNSTNKANGVAQSARDLDVYQQLEKLDFVTAAKILFNPPPKKKKFGLDFHLVQLFFACMPSLAVYLVAQYARYEIRRMEAEEELKKKQAGEEEKAKENEASALEEIEEIEVSPELLNVKVRLDSLEETVKQIAFETKKLSSGNLMADQDKTTDQDSTKRELNVSPNSASKLEERSSTPAMKPSASLETTASGSAPSPAPDTKQSDQSRKS